MRSTYQTGPAALRHFRHDWKNRREKRRIRPEGAFGIALRMSRQTGDRVDFSGDRRRFLHTGNRVSVRGAEYDGCGIVADDVSVLETLTAPVASAAPQSSTAEGDSALRRAREIQADTDRVLPDFVFREAVERYTTSAGQKQWRFLDKLSAEVTYSRRTGETYRDIRVNGRAVAKSWLALGGDISTGEFGSLLHSLLTNPDSAFELAGDAVVNGVPAREYSYHIGRSESDWRIASDYQYIAPSYRGRIWFRRDSNRVLRIERAAEGIPSAFPLDIVEGAVDFGEVRLGYSGPYLLPMHAETRVCVRDRRQCSRKSIEFRDYHKFTGDAKIRF